MIVDRVVEVLAGPRACSDSESWLLALCVGKCAPEQQRQTRFVRLARVFLFFLSAR